MTPSQHYRTILRDVERFLQERAYRYVMARHDQAPAELLAVQCDTLAVVIKTYLEPHVVWFEEEEERQKQELLTIDLAPEVLEEAKHGTDD